MSKGEASGVALGFSAEELAGQAPIGGRVLVERKQDPISSAEFLAELDDVANRLGLRVDRDIALAEAVAEGWVTLSEQEQMVNALADKVAEKLRRVR